MSRAVNLTRADRLRQRLDERRRRKQRITLGALLTVVVVVVAAAVVIHDRDGSGDVHSTNRVGPLARLTFKVQPGGTLTGGTAFPVQPVVAAADGEGHTITNYVGTMTLSIISGFGPSGAHVRGCKGALHDGVTVFSGCNIDKAGSGYQLHASDGTFSADSRTFDVGLGRPAQLVFTQKPGRVTPPLAAFPIQAIVTVQDAGGNTITGDGSTVALSIVAGTPASGSGVLSGCVGTETLGVVGFSGCEISAPGTGYKLRATDGFLKPADSAPFDVAASG